MNDTSKIADSQITASSYFIGDLYTYEPFDARLNLNSYWAPSEQYPENPWIQVDFQTNVLIHGLLVQGGYELTTSQYVTFLQIQVGETDHMLSYITNATNAPMVRSDVWRHISNIFKQDWFWYLPVIHFDIEATSISWRKFDVESTWTQCFYRTSKMCWNSVEKSTLVQSWIKSWQIDCTHCINTWGIH